MEYIHYGHKHFDKNLFEKLMNRNDCFTKPLGGLWASRVGAEYGWKEWVKDQNFRLDKYTEDNYFKFKLKDNARVLIIDNSKILDKLPKNKANIINISSWYSLDFEELSKKYDAIEVLITNSNGLYWKLYGWDCDSILIMNKNAVEEIKEEKENG